MFLHTHLLETRSTVLFQSYEEYNPSEINFSLKFIVLSNDVKYFINIVKYIDRYIFASVKENGIVDEKHLLYCFSYIYIPQQCRETFLLMPLTQLPVSPFEPFALTRQLFEQTNA